MDQKTRKIAGVAGSVLMLGTMGVGATAFAQEVGQPESFYRQDGQSQTTLRKSVANVQGTFSFNQTDIASLDTISNAIGRASEYLCGSTFSSGETATSEDVVSWTIEVSGTVENAFSATLGELSEESEEHATMGCSCGSNPAGGTASVNAQVTGVPLQTVLELARPSEGSNTVVLTSKDGYEVALPLSYVQHHYSLIVYDVNGAPLSDSVGGTNQLWLGSTPAFYFARNIVSIGIEARQTPPQAPGMDDEADANLPNVAIVRGGEAL